ncbi:MAG TPA: SpoIIE family protein phosphatase [Methylomirabilota bacterium]|nr:SpoIIE family protein phosphatase [Methylomirabilota bacterium]
MEPVVDSGCDNLSAASKVLVVDDNPDKRYLLSRILEGNFHVIQAENGRKALAMIEENQPDVVLLDVLMPGLDGFEVCRRMKADPKIASIPVLFVTVLNHNETRVEGLELGGEDFISWPVNPSELVARIKARVRASRPLGQLRSVVQEQSRLLEVERQRDAATQYELEQARLVQQRFVTSVFPQGRGLEFADRYRPSRQVGGDLFDVVPVDSCELALLMADISGHGVPAALLTSVTKVLFRTGVEQCSEPAKFLRWLNRQISSYLATGEFLTVFVGSWNAKTHIFSYTGAGHPPALVVAPDGKQVERLHVSQGIVGIMPDGNFPQRNLELKCGQRLICYTDGITEGINREQQIFGEERLADACARYAAVPLKTMVESVFEELDAFSNGEIQNDDQALLALEVIE